MSKYNYGDNSTGSNKSRSYPVSRILDGTYFWGSGALMQQDTASHLWSLTVQSDIKAYRLHMGVDYVRYQPMEKHAGNPVRCFYIFSTLSSTARWKERMFTNTWIQIINTIMYIMATGVELYGCQIHPIMEAQEHLVLQE